MAHDGADSGERHPIEVRHNPSRTIRQTIYSDGTRTAEILDPGHSELLAELAALLEEDAGEREAEDVEAFTQRVLEAMERTGTQPHLRHAFTTTQMLLTEETQAFWEPVQLLEWHAAIADWHHTHRTVETLRRLRGVEVNPLPPVDDLVEGSDVAHELARTPHRVLGRLARLHQLGRVDLAAREILACDARGDEFMAVVVQLAIVLVLRYGLDGVDAGDETPELAMAYAAPLNLENQVLAFLNHGVETTDPSLEGFVDAATTPSGGGPFWVELVAVAGIVTAALVATGRV